MDYWKRINAEIKRQKVTQDWVANNAGINFGTFRGWITRKRLPRVNEAVAIALTLNTTVEYLATGKDYNDPWILKNIMFITECKQLTEDQLSMIKTVVHTELTQSATPKKEPQREAN